MLFKLPGAFKQVTRLGKLHPRLGKRKRLVVVTNQQWLVIKQVEVRGAPVHEQEDHPLRLRGKVWRLGRERICRTRRGREQVIGQK